MPEWFEVSELLEVVVEDEKAGVALYSAAAEKARGDQVKELFGRLTEQEKHHQQRFESMRDEIGGRKTPEQYGGQYMAYLRALTGGRAFPDPATARRELDQCTGDDWLLRLADRYERDTLMVLREIESLVGESRHQDMVREVVEEERSHIVALSEALASLGRA